MLEVQLFDRAKKFLVAGVGARPPSFNVGDAEIVEFFRDPQFIFEGEGNVFRLAAVSQGCIVERDPFHSYLIGPGKSGRRAALAPRVWCIWHRSTPRF